MLRLLGHAVPRGRLADGPASCAVWNGTDPLTGGWCTQAPLAATLPKRESRRRVSQISPGAQPRLARAVVVISRLWAWLGEVYAVSARVQRGLHSEPLATTAPFQRLAAGVAASPGHNWRKMEPKRWAKEVEAVGEGRGPNSEVQIGTLRPAGRRLA